MAPRTLQEIVAEAERLRTEITQIFVDVAHWNGTHPGEPPIDPDPDGELCRIAEVLGKFVSTEQVRRKFGGGVMAEHLVSALHTEIVRVRELLPRYEEIGPAGFFGHMVLMRAIQLGEAALQSGDPGDMVYALARLRECTG